MLEVVLHDRAAWREHLLPLVYTRPVSDLRLGILTLAQKWELLLSAHISFYTEPHLQEKYTYPQSSPSYLVIRGNICPTDSLVSVLRELPEQTVLMHQGEWIAYRVQQWMAEPDATVLKQMDFSSEVLQIRFLEDIYLRNAQQIVTDYQLLTQGQQSADLHASNQLLGDDLFVGKDVQAVCCTFNTLGGPIYIGDGAVVEEGSHLKGPLAICASARVKMGSKLYPNVTVGPGATIGGEVNNTVLWGDCAKGHDGYLGCAVIGEGCNIGAGSSNSNLKNTWSPVKLYDYASAGLRDTGQHKVGTFMGDYAMCGINSSITTGNVLGVGAQVAMSNIIPKFVADFSWSTDHKSEPYHWEKFEAMLRGRAALKRQELSDLDLRILKSVHRMTCLQAQEHITIKK